MNKVLVEIYIPAIGTCFDMFVPVDIPIKVLTEVIVNGIVEITNRKYVASKCEQLCMKDPSGLLNPLLSLQNYGIKDGMQLYLI